MDKKKRRKYSTEFKREAVALAGHPGQTIAGVAEDLGVGANIAGSGGSANSLSTDNKRSWVKELPGMRS